MTGTASTKDERHGHLLGIRQFALLPMLAIVGAAWATGFPWVDPLYPFETRSIQFAAILAALCSGLTIAAVFRSTVAPKRHFVVVASALLGGHFFWVEPVWGFHHDYSLGIFAWLFLGGEDGFVIMPSVLGLPLTMAAFIAYIAVLRAIVASPKAT